jgi:hypothetical protein
VGFVVDKVALGQVSSEFFTFPCQYYSTMALHIHTHTHIICGMNNRLVSGHSSEILSHPMDMNNKECFQS